MKLKIINEKDIVKIKEIYEEAFPENERIDFYQLLKGASPNGKLYGLYEKDMPLGLCYLNLEETFCYLVYFAIDKDKRNLGYGGLALSLIKKKFKKPITLCVENPTTELKKRRIEFYKRNNFIMADFEFEYLNEKYYVMHTGEINKDKFIETMLLYFPGCTNFKKRDID